MLQQTRVATAAPYFERFVARFPDAAALAAASLDEVLSLWSGLGYYARARNLHQAAARIRDLHGGELPPDAAALAALPGVGRSTAAAILALALGQRHAILDGNVKRVLARYHRVDGWPGTGATQRRLWALAEAHTPAERVSDYTQAIMDLGATLCLPRRPVCERCPVAEGCGARSSGEVDRYPQPRAARPLPVRATRFLIVRDTGGTVLLERRPPTGVWASLWAFPEAAVDEPVEDWCLVRFGTRPRGVTAWPTFRHTFSHFHLDVTPVVVEVSGPECALSETGATLWHKPGSPPPGGLAAPVAVLLARLAELPGGGRFG